MSEAFFTRFFQSIRGVGFVTAIMLWPFRWATRWYANRGWMLRAALGAVVALILGPLWLLLLEHAALGEFQP
jgi:hypothetical protein